MTLALASIAWVFAASAVAMLPMRHQFLPAWVFAASAVAMLPMRHQFLPGLALLIAAPLLILWIGIAITWWAGLLAFAAFLSMFRNPLRYFWARARGQNPQLPPELR